MIEQKERCDKCKWWEGFDQSDRDNVDGWCHRYPPVMPSESEREKQAVYGLDDANWFPIVRAYEFCGEFKEGPRGGRYCNRPHESTPVKGK